MFDFRDLQAVTFQISTDKHTKVLSVEIFQLRSRNFDPNRRVNLLYQMNTSKSLHRIVRAVNRDLES